MAFLLSGSVQIQWIKLFFRDDRGEQGPQLRMLNE